MALRKSSAAAEGISAGQAQSELNCEVCGHFALVENTVHEYADALGDRWICEVCGAHRIE